MIEIEARCTKELKNCWHFSEGNIYRFIEDVNKSLLEGKLFMITTDDRGTELIAALDFFERHFVEILEIRIPGILSSTVRASDS